MALCNFQLILDVEYSSTANEGKQVHLGTLKSYRKLSGSLSVDD